LPPGGCRHRCGLSGPGALRLVRPDLDVTLLDSTRKKTNFLKETIQALGLDGVKALHGRAEEIGRDALHRDHYDLALARAVSSLPVLAELCLPLVKKGGLFIAMKGEADESQEASKAIHSLKGEVEDRILYHLPGLDQARSLILIRKMAATPGRFPRRMAQIRKSPL
ncbi:MAG: 16S rRNA (guanine(527)-N(7))-methyltransferase RsmG, partial [Clostridiaceae bacterium]|nr:16S rRNA (guanine(527)-N(7))-methyltransferase RsmG [Clostridiaceae bacterium]